MIMKKMGLLAGMLAAVLSLQAQQQQIPATDYFTIEGKVKEPLAVRVKELQDMPELHADSIEIFNHELERKGVLYNVQGVLLKEVLEKVLLEVESPKQLSEYYITCVASDNYKVVFSWNELFNNEMGEYVLLITQKDGIRMEEDEDRIAMIAPSDMATGRRYVKGLKRIVISRTEVP